jgi:D-tyrosyl-tRNA(Tyr) deacylase
MRAVVQRVSEASVSVGDEGLGRIGLGLVVLVGARQGDTEEDADWLAEKVANLRIFESTSGRMDRSALDAGLPALVVSQFTLYGDCRRGRRPDFTAAAPPEVAEPLIERFIARLRDAGLHVETGRFRAHMHVALVNDGPVTIIVDSPVPGSSRRHHEV